MKINTIKKLNVSLLLLLVSISMGLGFFAFVVKQQNSELDALRLAGKAGELAKDAATEISNDDQVVIPGFGQMAKDGQISIEPAGQEQQTPAEETEMAKKEEAKFSFAAIGDAESYGDGTGFNPELVDVLAASRKYNPDFALFTGDILSTSGANDAENKNRISNLRSVIQQHYNNYYITFGKHDIECGRACIDLWLEIFFGIKPSVEGERWLYHSFDFLNTHFILLSTDYPRKHSVDDAQLKWLEEDLAKNEQPNTVVAQHVPPVNFFKESAKECHDMSCDEQASQKLLSLYKQYKVDLVISGHENAFDHQIVDGIDFVLSGQAGSEPRYKNVIKGDIYSLFSIDGEEIQLEAINSKGEIIRTIKIK